MKKRSRELNIFSMSALDLFASALGAFILITIVLLPFFPNLNLSGQAEAELEQAEAELEQAEAELEQAKAELEKEKAQKAKLAREKARLEREKAKLEKAKAPKAKSQLEKRVEALQQEIDDTTVLLGIKTKAKKFAFVIDMSGSIYQPTHNDYRPFITLSIQDMLAAFKAEIEVCLIGFHAPNRKTTLHYWPQSRGFFQVKKTTRNRVVEQVERWMRSVNGGTPTRAALLAAIALHPEEIILLSDGAPSEDWRLVVRTVTAENRRRIPIHAVAVGHYTADRDFIDFLVQLTKRNNGYVVGAKPG